MYNNIIAIPYRKREKHLEHYIKHTVPLIQKFLPNTRVVVIEQNEGKLFNRGKILNVAFKEYENKTKYFLTNDVDLNPTQKCLEEYYKKEVDDNHVLGIYTSQCDTLGGIIKIKDNIIQKINGFPNDIWGWGIEDTALQNRSEYFNIKKITNLTNKKEHPSYLLRFDDVKDRVTKNHSKNRQIHKIGFKKLNKQDKLKKIMSSGLNNIEYTILERKMIHEIVELIYVDI
jgi:hypothetical protein